ncbi:MAG: hypothetical protein ACO3UU_04725, partial [Minisyncoccia bacterium]
MSEISKLRKKYSYVLPSLPDDRDRMYVAGSVKQGEYSLSPFRGKIWHQGTWGSCTGHGTVGMLHTFYKRVAGLEIDFNPYWIWYWGRKANNTQTQNVGAYVRDIFANLVNKGVCENSLWKPSNFDEKPPRITNKNIIKFKGYKRFDFNKNDFDSIKNDFYYCIGEEKLPVGITMAVHKSFELYTAKTGQIKLPDGNDPVLGYHWVYVDG